MDLFAARTRPDAVDVARVKDWVLDVLRPPATSTVMVTQLVCREPGCPPLETVIAVLDSQGRRRHRTVHASVASLTRADIEALLADWAMD